MFDSKKYVLVETVDARKEKMVADQVWALFEGGATVLVAKGKKVFEFPVEPSRREDILAVVLGRSGTLRAPTIKIGERFLVGFNDEIYASLL